MWLRTSDDEVRGDQKKMEAGCGQGKGMGSGHGRRSCAQYLCRSSRNNRPSSESESESDSRSFTTLHWHSFTPALAVTSPA